MFFYLSKSIFLFPIASIELVSSSSSFGAHEFCYSYVRRIERRSENTSSEFARIERKRERVAWLLGSYEFDPVVDLGKKFLIGTEWLY